MAEQPLLVTTEELMNLLRVSRQTISNYKDQGMPAASRGKWDLRKVFSWYVEKTQAQLETSVAEITSEAEKLRKLTIEADLKQLELDQQRGKLVEIDTVIMELSRVMTVVRNTITSLPNKLAPDLTGRPLKEVKIILQKGVVESVRAIDFCSYYQEPKKKRTNGTKEARPATTKEARPARTAKNGKAK